MLQFEVSYLLYHTFLIISDLRFIYLLLFNNSVTLSNKRNTRKCISYFEFSYIRYNFNYIEFIIIIFTIKRIRLH